MLRFVCTVRILYFQVFFCILYVIDVEILKHATGMASLAISANDLSVSLLKTNKLVLP